MGTWNRGCGTNSLPEVSGYCNSDEATKYRHNRYLTIGRQAEEKGRNTALGSRFRKSTVSQLNVQCLSRLILGKCIVIILRITITGTKRPESGLALTTSYRHSI